MAKYRFSTGKKNKGKLLLLSALGAGYFVVMNFCRAPEGAADVRCEDSGRSRPS